MGEHLNKRLYALLGVAAPLTAIFFIGVSISLSPWFRWGTNALSDLGHSLNSEAAPVFNLGLLITGFLAILYAVTAFRMHAKKSSFFLAASAFLLQLVGLFDEVYGSLHFVVSVMFFLSVGIFSILYSAEKKSHSTAIAFIISLASWILYVTEPHIVGIAVPECISSIAIVWPLLSSAAKIYRETS